MANTGEAQRIEIPTIPGASHGLSGEFAIPDGDGPWPGVVLVHEAFGINDVMRRQAERFAHAGYLAIMPDLFTEGGARKCLTQTFRDLASGSGRAFSDIESARQLLLARSDCNGKAGVIGFCMGGGFALLAATRGFEASSVNYGRLPKEIDEALGGACPIVGSYGAKDGSLRNAARKLDDSLSRLGIVHDVKEYPDAGHAFLNDADSAPPLLGFLMKRLMGLGPQPEAARDAWQRIDAFFAEHLRSER